MGSLIEGGAHTLPACGLVRFRVHRRAEGLSERFGSLPRICNAVRLHDSRLSSLSLP